MRGEPAVDKMVWSDTRLWIFTVQQPTQYNKLRTITCIKVHKNVSTAAELKRLYNYMSCLHSHIHCIIWLQTINIVKAYLELEVQPGYIVCTKINNYFKNLFFNNPWFSKYYFILWVYMHIAYRYLQQVNLLISISFFSIGVQCNIRYSITAVLNYKNFMRGYIVQPND